MYKNRGTIALALLMAALTINAAVYAILSSTIISAYQTKANVRTDTFWRAMSYSKAGIQQLNDGIKHIFSIEDAGLIISPSDRESEVVDVAILIPTTTNMIKYPSLQKLTLMTQCLPSIISTAEPRFNYQIYIGTERYDFLATQLDKIKVSKVAKIRNRYNQVPHLTQDTNGKVTNSQKTPQTRAKRSALSQQVTTKHI